MKKSELKAGIKVQHNGYVWEVEDTVLPHDFKLVGKAEGMHVFIDIAKSEGNNLCMWRVFGGFTLMQDASIKDFGIVG